MKWGIWTANWEVECNSFALLFGSGNCCQRLQRTSVQMFRRLLREKAKERSDRPSDLELFARAISNIIIFASKKLEVCHLQCRQKLLTLSLHQVVWPPAIQPQRMICGLALKSSWMRLVSWQTRGFWQKTLSLFHPLPTAIILLLDYRNNR